LTIAAIEVFKYFKRYIKIYLNQASKKIEIAYLKSPLDLNVIRNTTGHIIRFDGISWNVFEWLSAAHINATYNQLIDLFFYSIFI